MVLTVNQLEPDSRKYTPDVRRIRHALDGQDIRSSAHVCAVPLSSFMYSGESSANCLFQRIVNLLFGPEERILILYPLVIAHCYTAGIGQNIGNEKNTSFFKHSICTRRGRA